ncbi:MAG: hypothetical protein OES13_10740, partial [Acidimicrobiia bacterium]|nr:hypothetical protein [Acidimicrobiia bacterium]
MGNFRHIRISRGVGVALTSFTLVVSLFPSGLVAQEELPQGWGSPAAEEPLADELPTGWSSAAPTAATSPTTSSPLPAVSSTTSLPTQEEVEPVLTEPELELAYAGLAARQLWFEGFVAASEAISAPVARSHAGGIEAGGIVTNNYQAWEPNNAAWGPGSATGYAEGDVVAFSIQMDSGAAASTQYYLTACFDYFNSAYAFIDMEPWDTFTSPAPTLRGGAITGTHAAGAAIDWGTVDDVTVLVPGAASSPCSTGDLGYELTFTTGGGTPPDNFYLYFGGELARFGATTDAGDLVGAGEGVGSWPIGTFMAYLENVTGKKTIPLKPGQITPTGTIVIEKSTDPAGGTGFGFTDDIAAPNSFGLDDGQSQTFVALTGSYSVTEDDPAASGFELSDLSCVDSDTGGTASTGDVGTRTASIELDDFEVVTCTFNNSINRGNIIIEKVTDPSGSAQSFT